jgi:Mor family transcriptional regulator
MEKIREEYKFGKNITQLSKEFGINEGTIFLVINNKIYTR